MSFASAPLDFGSLKVRLPVVAPGLKIGLLGGSFNPPHEGHLQISLWALKRLGLDRLWWLVSPGNPLKEHRELARLEHRMALSRLLANKHPLVEITAFEAQLPSAYTARTLTFLRRRLPGVRFVWIMGADNLAHFHRWEQWRTIMAAMPVAVLDRPGYRRTALSSRAAMAYARARLPEAAARRLAFCKPPAWCYLTIPLSELSSTAIRNAAREK